MNKRSGNLERALNHNEQQREYYLRRVDSIDIAIGNITLMLSGQLELPIDTGEVYE